MKKSLTLITVLALITLQSCKKEKVPAPVAPQELTRIATKEIPGISTVYSYNTDGSIKEIAVNGYITQKYQYQPGKVILTTHLNDGSVGETVQHSLNPDGLITEQVSDKYPGHAIKYIYNSNKKVAIKEIYSNTTLSTITKYFYSDSNLVKDSTYTASGSPQYSRTYEYFTDKLSTTESANMGMAWLKGLDNKNILKKNVVTTDATGTITGGFEYTAPLFDAKQRMLQITYQSIIGNISNSITYTYK